MGIQISRIFWIIHTISDFGPWALALIATIRLLPPDSSLANHVLVYLWAGEGGHCYMDRSYRYNYRLWSPEGSKGSIFLFDIRGLENDPERVGKLGMLFRDLALWRAAQVKQINK